MKASRIVVLGLLFGATCGCAEEDEEPGASPMTQSNGGSGSGGGANASGPGSTEGMTRVPANAEQDTAEFFIDPYEAFVVDGEATSVSGAVPTVEVTFSEAQAACVAVDKRLCTSAEWVSACIGPDGLAAALDEDPLVAAEVCGVARTTGRFDPPSATGSYPDCKTSGLDVWDMIGNASEWTLSPNGGQPSGAPFYWSAANSDCYGYLAGSEGTALPETESANDIGFRCCADAS